MYSWKQFYIMYLIVISKIWLSLLCNREAWRETVQAKSSYIFKKRKEQM